MSYVNIAFNPPRADRAGAHILHIPVPIGTVTASQTNAYSIPVKGEYVLLGASIICHTVAISAGGTLPLTICKRLGTDDSRIALTSALNIETLTTLKTASLSMATGLTAVQRRLIESRLDSLYIEIVSDAAIGTAPTNLVVMLEVALLK